MSEEQGSESTVSRNQSLKEEQMAKEKEAPKKLSRKDFVKGAAAVAGAGALASCAPAATPTVAPEATATAAPAAAPTPVPETWDMETDVVVVGSGVGKAAAIEAKAAGADVLLLEKNDWAGGLQLAGGDNMAIGGGTVVQLRDGETRDTFEQYYQDELYSSDYRGVPEILHTLCERGPELIVWMQDLGLEFAPLGDGPFRPDIKRDHTVAPSPNYPGRTERPDGGLTEGGIAVHTVLYREMERLGVPVLLNHRMKSMYREPNGPVLGLMVDTPEGTINIKARKGVILCTGTWTDNYRMVQAWDPRAVGPDCYGDGGTPSDGTLFVDSAGDGHLAAAEIGAGFADMSFVAYYNIFWGSRSYWGWDPPVFTEDNHQSGKGFRSRNMNWERVILVKNDGARWINEAECDVPAEPGRSNYAERPENPYTTAYLSLTQPRNVWAIADADQAAAAEWPVDELRNPDPKRGAMWDPACVAVADTLEELASKMDVPADALEATVSKYNGFVDAGEDADFGRPMPMYKVATPPFYAVKASLIRHTQRNGLRVNTKSQVLEQSDQRDGYSGRAEGGSISIDDEKVIPHFYAAGETGNSQGWRRIHRSISHYITAARIAGENAAEETPLA